MSHQSLLPDFTSMTTQPQISKKRHQLSRLPAELWIQILFSVEFLDLWRNYRMVSRLFRHAAEEVIQDSLLPLLTLHIPREDSSLKELKFHSLHSVYLDRVLFHTMDRTATVEPTEIVQASQFAYQAIEVAWGTTPEFGRRWSSFQSTMVKLNFEKKYVLVRWKDLLRAFLKKMRDNDELARMVRYRGLELFVSVGVTVIPSA